MEYGPLADGVLFGFDESGPDLITGGSLGLEASLLTTIVLCGGILILLFGGSQPTRQDAREHALVPRDV